jgi:hypothetical protein
VNVLDLGDGGEWIVRAVNVAAYDLLHLAHRQTTMERYWNQYQAISAQDRDPLTRGSRSRDNP